MSREWVQLSRAEILRLIRDSRMLVERLRKEKYPLKGKTQTLSKEDE